MINHNNLIFNQPLEYRDGIIIKVPTIEDIASNPRFPMFSRVFTIRTREIFATNRNVDDLERQYPTIWSFLKEEESDMFLGKFFGIDYPGSAFVMEALSYWTGLDLDKFQKLNNGKIIHTGSDWVIDAKEFLEFSKIIRQVICFEPSSDYSPPKPMNSDAKYKAWLGLYKGRMRSAGKKGITIADKILILSISMDNYIPPDDIKKMSIFLFNKLFEGLSRKEAYETQMSIMLSDKFKSDGKSPKHWKETFRINKN